MFTINDLVFIVGKQYLENLELQKQLNEMKLELEKLKENKKENDLERE